MIKLLICVLMMISDAICDEYENEISFTVFNNDTGATFLSTFHRSLTEDGCDPEGKFSFITHGWMGSTSAWIPELISNLSYFRGGCVIFMNYSTFSDNVNYFKVIQKFKPIAKLTLRKLKQLESEHVPPNNIFMFGFSFGGRIIIEAALNFGNQRIGSVDICDMAGPGFDFIYKRDPKNAAKNVQCLHTSATAGTIERNCHQNWLLGYCGRHQPAGQDIQVAYCELLRNCDYEPILSHGLCPFFYTSAFRHDFIADNFYNCSSSRMVKDLPPNYKMGYMESRQK